MLEDAPAARPACATAPPVAQPQLEEPQVDPDRVGTAAAAGASATVAMMLCVVPVQRAASVATGGSNPAGMQQGRPRRRPGSGHERRGAMSSAPKTYAAAKKRYAVVRAERFTYQAVLGDEWAL